MNFKKIAKIVKGQDGAIWNDFLFRFDHQGECWVYDLNSELNDEELTPFSTFRLGSLDKLTPHSNSVTFSNEFFTETDEFPLLFTNVYNNYQKEAYRKEGICCIYRITKVNTDFTACLVGVVEIGFVNDSKFWCSPNGEDIRPYGNFVVDRKNGKLFVYTMRDELKSTRYFSFKLPKIMNAETDDITGIKRIVLNEADIEYYFDTEYHHFIQGGCVENDKIYSLEGFTDSEENPPAMRIISIKNRCQEDYIPFSDYELTVEPELIDFFGGICYYCDHTGNLYTIDF